MSAAIAFQPKIGVLVNVQSRTWPGINKPGGVGRIIDINQKDSVTSVDVQYILGGKEASVELEYVQEHNFDDTEKQGRSSRRNRKSVEVSNESKKEQSKTKVASVLKSAVSKANEKLGGNAKDKELTKKRNKKEVNLSSKFVCKKKLKSYEPKVSKSVMNVSTKKVQSIQKKQSVKNNLNSMKKAPMVSMIKTSSENVQNKTMKTLHGTNSSIEKNVGLGIKFNSIKPVIEVSSNKSLVKKFEPPNWEKKPDNERNKLRPKPIIDKNESIPNSSTRGILKNVFKDISTKAVDFVQDIIGKNLNPSTPESSSSLELEMENKRIMQFNERFSIVVREKRVEEIDINVLRDEINAAFTEKPFSGLEMRSHLERLDKENKIMVTWDSGTVYML